MSAFADGIEANPNPRFFPPEQAFNATWDLGVQATWAPNDILTANSAADDYAARAASFDAQAQVVRDNIVVEVTQDFEQLKQAEFGIESTRRALASATEAYRVARELFNNGRGKRDHSYRRRTGSLLGADRRLERLGQRAHGAGEAGARGGARLGRGGGELSSMMPAHYEGQDLEALADIPGYQNWLLGAFRDAVRGRILEVGAGTGNLANVYLPRVDQAVLVEPAPNLTHRAARAVPREREGAGRRGHARSGP